MRKPNPKRKDLILKEVNDSVKLSSDELESEVEGIVEFKGSLVEYFDIGEKVLFNKNKATKIEFFNETYWKIYEDYVTCGIKEKD